MPQENNLNETPNLWLDLQPEYIDVNLDKFVNYLYQRHNDTSAQGEFYNSSIGLLRNRVSQLVASLASSKMGSVQDTQDLLDRTCREVKILVLYVLMKAFRTERELHVAVASAEMMLVKLCSVEYREDLLNNAVKLLNAQGKAQVDVAWSHVRGFVPDQLAKCLLETKIEESKSAPMWYENNGSAKLENKCLTLSTLSKEACKSQKNLKSFDVCGGSIELRSEPSLKLNQLKLSDYAELEAFRKRYVEGLIPIVHKKTLRQYKYGDVIRVRVVRTAYGDVEVRSVDPQYEYIGGKCSFQNKFFYSLQDFSQHLMVGSEIEVLVKRVDGEISEFDITPTFSHFLMEEYDGVGRGKQVLARALFSKQNFMWWWSEFGYSLSSFDRGYEPGSFALLTINNIDTVNGYINAEFDEVTEETFDEVESRKYCIESFCFEPSEPEEDEKEVEEMLDETSIRLLARVLYVLQKQMSQPLERYKLLCTTQVLCRLTGDEESKHFAGFVAQTLLNMVFFARGEYGAMDVPEPDVSIENLPGVRRRSDIVFILMQYGSVEKTDQPYLETKIESDDELLSKLATLVQSGVRLRNVLTGAMQRQIEREITRQLMVDEESATDFLEGNDSFYGVEDDRKEFKTSFVYPPDNQMQPNEAVQKMNVFRGVCAMLNTREGGVLYLGVNDHGMVSGIEQDMNFLKLKTIDAYLRHINDEAKKCFGLQLLPYIKLEALNENRVVAIHVDPCDFKVVELDGVAYIRTNAESRKMDDATRILVHQRKVHFDASRAKVENSLSLAMEHRKQVQLQGYNSSNSGCRNDRLVEAFSFAKGNKHVWCYELESGKVKLFATSRIGDVLVMDAPWAHQREHKEGLLDIFYMTGKEPIHIVMMLDMMAKNLLVEEYPDAASQLTYCKDGRWQLETDVFSLSGIGRFYMGLARNIDIVSAPGLKEYAQEYMRKAGLA